MQSLFVIDSCLLAYPLALIAMTKGKGIVEAKAMVEAMANAMAKTMTVAITTTITTANAN